MVTRLSDDVASQVMVRKTSRGKTDAQVTAEVRWTCWG